MRILLKVKLKLLVIILTISMNNLVWANSDSTIIIDKSCELKIICKKLKNDSLKVTLKNLSNKSIYLQLGSYTYPTRRADTLLVFIGLFDNPLDDIRYYSIFALKPKESIEINTEGAEIEHLKIYLTVLLNQKYVKSKFDKEKCQYKYKIENTIYHKLKRKYLLYLKVDSF
jgi:hypothetical protein